MYRCPIHVGNGIYAFYSKVNKNHILYKNLHYMYAKNCRFHKLPIRDDHFVRSVWMHRQFGDLFGDWIGYRDFFFWQFSGMQTGISLPRIHSPIHSCSALPCPRILKTWGSIREFWNFGVLLNSLQTYRGLSVNIMLKLFDLTNIICSFLFSHWKFVLSFIIGM